MICAKRRSAQPLARRSTTTDTRLQQAYARRCLRQQHDVHTPRERCAVWPPLQTLRRQVRRHQRGRTGGVRADAWALCRKYILSCFSRVSRDSSKDFKSIWAGTTVWESLTVSLNPKHFRSQVCCRQAARAGGGHADAWTL